MSKDKDFNINDMDFEEIQKMFLSFDGEEEEELTKQKEADPDEELNAELVKERIYESPEQDIDNDILHIFESGANSIRIQDLLDRRTERLTQANNEMKRLLGEWIDHFGRAFHKDSPEAKLLKETRKYVPLKDSK